MTNEKNGEWKDSKCCEEKIRVSIEQKTKLKKLARTLNMTVSGLVVMMVGDVIKDKPALNADHHRTGKRAKHVTKSEVIRIFMARDYRDKIIKSLEVCKYEYYVSEFIAECIEKQLQEFVAFSDLEDDDGTRIKGTDLQTYIKAKADLLGVSSKQVEQFYIGKYVNKMLEESRYERLTMMEPKMIREIYGLGDKKEV